MLGVSVKVRLLPEVTDVVPGVIVPFETCVTVDRERRRRVDRERRGDGVVVVDAREHVDVRVGVRAALRDAVDLHVGHVVAGVRRDRHDLAAARHHNGRRGRRDGAVSARRRRDRVARRSVGGKARDDRVSRLHVGEARVAGHAAEVRRPVEDDVSDVVARVRRDGERRAVRALRDILRAGRRDGAVSAGHARGHGPRGDGRRERSADGVVGCNRREVVAVRVGVRRQPQRHAIDDHVRRLVARVRRDDDICVAPASTGRGTAKARLLIVALP